MIGRGSCSELWVPDHGLSVTVYVIARLRHQLKCWILVSGLPDWSSSMSKRTAFVKRLNLPIYGLCMWAFSGVQSIHAIREATLCPYHVQTSTSWARYFYKLSKTTPTLRLLVICTTAKICSTANLDQGQGCQSCFLLSSWLVEVRLSSKTMILENAMHSQSK